MHAIFKISFLSISICCSAQLGFSAERLELPMAKSNILSRSSQNYVTLQSDTSISFPSYSDPRAYYTKQISKFSTASSSDLKAYLKSLLNLAHIRNEGDYDTLADDCSNEPNSCVPVMSYDYESARKLLFGSIHLTEQQGSFAIEPLYCGNKVLHKSIGVLQIPYGSGLNCEHIWPKSRFDQPKNSGPYKLMLSDLHHLYPAYATVNSTRGSNRFGVPSKPHKISGCSNNMEGPGDYGHLFYPRQEVRGDIARATFYFSIRYGLEIDDREEQTLREWNALDPVSSFEVHKNNLVYRSQGNRNPFIDLPGLSNYIDNF